MQNNLKIENVLILGKMINASILLLIFAPLLFTEIIGDFMLVLKIFALISIITFILNHVGNTPIAGLLIIGVSWFVLFDYWNFFGGIYLFYVLLTLGISGMLVDLFFISGMVGDRNASSAEDNSPVSSSLDLAQRSSRLEAARKMHSIHARPRGMMRR